MPWDAAFWDDLWQQIEPAVRVWLCDLPPRRTAEGSRKTRAEPRRGWHGLDGGHDGENPPAGDTPLNIVREWTLTSLGGRGIICLCCDQRVQLYKRRLDWSMALGLVWLVRTSGASRHWVHQSRQPKRVLNNGMFAQLAHWGLTEERANARKKQGSGYWRPTDTGIRFAYAEITVPSHVYLYNQQYYGCTDTPLTIREALGTRFSYADLMAPAGLPEDLAGVAEDPAEDRPEDPRKDPDEDTQP